MGKNYKERIQGVFLNSRHIVFFAIFVIFIRFYIPNQFYKPDTAPIFLLFTKLQYIVLFRNDGKNAVTLYFKNVGYLASLAAYTNSPSFPICHG